VSQQQHVQYILELVGLDLSASCFIVRSSTVYISWLEGKPIHKLNLSY